MRRFLGVTTTQIAKMCGVSQGTVDRALHNRGGIDPKTKEKILKVAREYEYLPHAANGNGNGCSMLIGVVLFDLYNEFFSKLAMSLVDKAKADGYSVIFLFSGKEIKEERAAIEYFNYIGADGIVLFPVGSDEEEYKSYLHSMTKPIVTLGNRLFDLPYIGIDDYRAMYDVTAEMLSQIKGKGKIRYFAPILKTELHEMNAQRQRLNGFVKAMEEVSRDYEIVSDADGLSRDSAAIICSTDYYALTVFRHFGELDGIRISGFDSTSLLDYVNSDVLTVEYSTDEIAEECMNYFLRRKYNANIRYAVLNKARTVF